MRRKGAATLQLCHKVLKPILQDSSGNQASGFGEKEHDTQSLGHHQLGATLIKRSFS